MKKYLYIFIIISLILGVTAYLATSNIIIAASSFVISGLVSYFLFIPKLVRFYSIIDRFNECYHFINNFIVCLSIKSSIISALESTSLSMSGEFKGLYEKMENMNEDDKLDYLVNYFPFNSYKLFVHLIRVWENEGGDILSMSNYLLSELRYEEVYITEIKSLAKRKYVESATLWIICIAIIILLRFTLNDFYKKINGQMIFIIGICFLIIFILISIYLLINSATKIKLKGINTNAKII